MYCLILEQTVYVNAHSCIPFGFGRSRWGGRFSSLAFARLLKVTQQLRFRFCVEVWSCFLWRGLQSGLLTLLGQQVQSGFVNFLIV